MFILLTTISGQRTWISKKQSWLAKKVNVKAKDAETKWCKKVNRKTTRLFFFIALLQSVIKSLNL